MIVLFGVSSITIAQNISKNDSIQIVEKVEDWNKAWKIKDANLAAKWYSDDSEFTNAFGFGMIGKSAINEYLLRVFKMDFVMAGNSEQTSLKKMVIGRLSLISFRTLEVLTRKNIKKRV